MSAAAGTPPRWSGNWNPSAWSQRLPIVGLALVGFGIATYLALFQWKLIGRVWEPFFGAGSEVILSSSVSRILPIPDAALGAMGSMPSPALSAGPRAGAPDPGSSSSSGWPSARWALPASCR